MLFTAESAAISLEEFINAPHDRTEWVNRQLIEKKETTVKTGRIQANLAF